LTVARPAEACALTARHLAGLVEHHGKDGARWRVNVADDIRWEYVAPGLFTVAPRAYCYTKWSPAERPGRAGLRVVYSATERWTTSDVLTVCRSGHRVAVVFDVPNASLFPGSIQGVPVVNGDATDDLWQHRAGSIVALKAKGTVETRRRMRQNGFSFSADPATW
jgi:hypothetical protein